MGQKLREGKRVSTSAKTVTPPEGKCSFDMNRPIDVQLYNVVLRYVLVHRMPPNWPWNVLFHEMSSDSCNQARYHPIAPNQARCRPLS